MYLFLNTFAMFEFIRIVIWKEPIIGESWSWNKSTTEAIVVNNLSNNSSQIIKNEFEYLNIHHLNNFLFGNGWCCFICSFEIFSYVKPLNYFLISCVNWSI